MNPFQLLCVRKATKIRNQVKLTREKDLADIPFGVLADYEVIREGTFAAACERVMLAYADVLDPPAIECDSCDLPIRGEPVRSDVFTYHRGECVPSDPFVEFTYRGQPYVPMR